MTGLKYDKEQFKRLKDAKRNNQLVPSSVDLYFQRLFHRHLKEGFSLTSIRQIIQESVRVAEEKRSATENSLYRRLLNLLSLLDEPERSSLAANLVEHATTIEDLKARSKLIIPRNKWTEAATQLFERKLHQRFELEVEAEALEYLEGLLLSVPTNNLIIPADNPFRAIRKSKPKRTSNTAIKYTLIADSILSGGEEVGTIPQLNDAVSASPYVSVPNPITTIKRYVEAPKGCEFAQLVLLIQSKASKIREDHGPAMTNRLMHWK